MTVGHDVVAAPDQKRGVADNPLVRAAGRVPLPLGAKLLIGFALVAALLVVGYVLGLVALNQSNVRGQRLQKLQATEAYVQQVESDSRRLLGFVVNCSGIGLEAGCRPPSGASREVYSVLDGLVTTSTSQLMEDVRAPLLPAGATPLPRSVVTRVLAELNALLRAYSFVSLSDAAGKTSDFSSDFGSDFSKVKPGHLREAQILAQKVYAQLASVAESASNEAQHLVAANHRSFTASRNLLLGVAGGSLVLAVALGLLLSWSLVAPIRRTEARLEEIAGGDFSSRLDVPNRDELGALAANVNRMNDELRRVYAELETGSRNKSEFLANMSHELRTPLNAIIGFSEVLHEQMFGELNERQLAYVDDIREAGRHQLSLINELLDLAKIEAGRMELKLSQVAVPDVLRAAVAMHAERASRGRIELSLATEPEEIVVTADELRVRQVVYNLLSNAVKFTPPQGRIDISAHAVDGHVEVAVADTGPGLSAQDLETIFEEFGQTAEGKQVEGTGLGLPLSRKLVELHGGHLWAESDPGRGSTFRFTLPIAQEAS
jgi:signal transduction histidine kinase